jgi:hypothetical protein
VFARQHLAGRLSRLIASAVAANAATMLMAQIAAACTNGNGFPH